MRSRLSIQQLICLTLAVGLLAVFLAPGLAQAQEPPGSQGLWQTFTTANSGLRDNNVAALLEDQGGGVWVGTWGGGVSRYFEGTWQTFSTESGNLGSNQVSALLVDRAGGLWVGTWGGGVSRFFDGVWRTFSIETGALGSNEVSALLVDRAGGLWVGTWGGGVSRYFEGAWQTFTMESGGLGDNYVTALLVDWAGGVWIGTGAMLFVGIGSVSRAGGDGGRVSHYLEGSWQTFSVGNGALGSNSVTALLEDQAGGLWVGTYGGGMNRYFEGAWQAFSAESGSLGDDNVRTLLEDQAGGVWVGTEGGGVNRYFEGTWQTFSVETGSLGHNNVRELLEDRAGGLWVGTSGGGVSRYFQGIWQTFSVKSGALGSNSVTALLADWAGGLWVGTVSGVSHYSEGAWQTFSLRTGELGDNSVTALLADQAGGVWVGTQSGGLSCYFEGLWQTFSVETGELGSNEVSALLADQAGGVWVGTGRGVSRYFEGTWHTFTVESGALGSNYVNVLLAGQSGEVWVGTSSGGVSRYLEGTWQTFSAESGALDSYFVTALLKDQAGGVWVGTWGGGVSRYFEGAWRTFSTESGSLGDNNVRALLEDQAGGIWVGTSSGGLSRYFEGTWQIFSVETRELGSNKVSALLEDQAGGVWVGTGGPFEEEGGINRYFQGAWQTFSVETGELSSNSVTALLKDRASGVWVGTWGGGVSRYSKGTWQTFAIANAGLSSNYVSELLEDRAGGLWVGTYSGGVSYHRPGSNRPWVLLRQLEVERGGRIQSYDLSGGNVPKMSLDFPVERLTIRFIGADLDSHPSNIRYFHQLEGWDTARRPTVEGVAQYENLPPGRYTFVVQSLDEDLTFSPEARLAIVIPAPFWRTGWFWGGMALIAVGAVVTGRRWQRNRRLAALRRGEDPYIVGAAIEEPEKFYGRREILARILAALRAGNHVAVYGERRIGKTSLLHQLAYHLHQIRDAEHRYLPVFVSLQITPSEDRFFYNLMREAANAARREVGADRLSNLRCDEPRAGYSSLDMAYDLDTTLSALETRGDKPTRLVLLLDEADQMNSYDPHTQGALRGLLMRFPRRVLLVWSGRAINRDWRLDTSPWYNLFKHEIRLDAFPEEEEDEIRRLIREPVRGLLDYDDEAVAQILAYSGRKPHAIQRLCSAAVRQALAAERTRITVEDVQRAHRLLTEEDTARATEEVEPVVYPIRSPVEQLAEDREDYQESPQDDG